MRFVTISLSCLMLLNPLLARSILQTDEFNATVINGSLWNIASTCQGLNQGGFCYANDTSIIYPFNGTLVIQPKIKTQCINATCGVQVASGRVSSAFTSNTGRYEIRAQLPSGDYLKSSVWLFIDTQETQDDGYEDALGEIDILLAASNATSNVTSNIWANDAMSGNVTQVATSNYFKNGTDFTAGFHTFSLEWTCKNLTIFVDNVPVLQKSIKKNRNAFSPNWFNYLLNIDVTVGTDSNITLSDTQLQNASTTWKPLLVDYVKLWENLDDSCPPLPAPVSSTVRYSKAATSTSKTSFSTGTATTTKWKTSSSTSTTTSLTSKTSASTSTTKSWKTSSSTSTTKKWKTSSSTSTSTPSTSKTSSSTSTTNSSTSKTSASTSTTKSWKTSSSTSTTKKWKTSSSTSTSTPSTSKTSSSTSTTNSVTSKTSSSTSITTSAASKTSSSTSTTKKSRWNSRSRSSYTSAVSTRTSPIIKPAVPSTTTRTSPIIKPAIPSAATRTSPIVKPAIPSTKTRTSPIVKPAIPSAATRTSIVVKPAVTSARRPAVLPAITSIEKRFTTKISKPDLVVETDRPKASTA